MTVQLALPTGDARPAVASLLQSAGLVIPGYESGSRELRAHNTEEGVSARVFREKDIPIQVALGNYHLGICGDHWLSEMQVRFPLQRVVRVGSLAGPATELWLAAAPESGLAPGTVPAADALGGGRVASEFPNLADLAAVHLRIPGYELLPIAGGAEAYPPEDADVVLVPARGAADVTARGLVPLHRLLAGSLALIANADALGTEDLAPVLARLARLVTGQMPVFALPRTGQGVTMVRARRSNEFIRLALPDGHQQPHTVAALKGAGLEFEGYSEKQCISRPSSGIDGLAIKVVRPQDMPRLVAMGVFDIAITGVDSLQEHLARFPGSPLKMAADLGRARYKIGPVVDEQFPAATTAEAVGIWRSLGRPVTIASEFPGLAEAFARTHHLHYATIIPISGASEGYVPEDADILIEGSETGTSIRANRLKMLDPFMESTNCVIVRREPVTDRSDLLAHLLARFRIVAVEAVAN